ncbi:hypothetical protein [Variovorax sp. Sphag1AA]|uniref:hypothetical protein n=1 Tax=Variovorax sp. Sphag1AA TaxID=2587027 RepID=UPI00160E42EE|nr:hypothetical protein [Variovorax sp. Sphag1AA]MBB3175861.1 hypothetical protein [Variovorax sp. Sphag1AA]
MDRNLSCGTGPSTLALVTARGGGAVPAPVPEIERIARPPSARAIADVRRDAPTLAKDSAGDDRGG